MKQIAFPRQDEAYLDFVVSLKGAVDRHAYGSLQAHFQQHQTNAEAQAERPSPDEIAEQIAPLLPYKFNRAVARRAQEMMWSGVISAYQPYEAQMVEWVNTLHPDAGNTLSLDPTLELPSYLAQTEFHIQPGGYYGHGDMTAIQFEKGASLYFKKTTLAFRIQRALAERLPAGNYGRILDLGCSDGGNAIAFKQAYPTAQVEAIDLAAPQLKLAYQQAVEHGAAIHFSQQNALSLNFPANSFDAVVCYILFHEMPRSAVRQALAEARRVLRPGGIMYSGDVTPFRENDPYRSFISSWQVQHNGEPFWREILEQTHLPTLFEEAGFERVAEFGVAASKVSPKFPWVTLGYKPAYTQSH